MSAIANKPTAVSLPLISLGRLPWLRIWTALSIVGLAAVVYFGLVYAGTDIIQGNVQRIFYFHVAAFSGATIAFFVSVFGALAYLRTRSPRWDTLAQASIEVGLMLSCITLFTGMIWARPTWNTWWTWDPRLTSAAIMVLTYAAYLMLRSGIESGEKRRLFASVYALLAFTTVIFTIVVIRVRPDTIHPTVIANATQSSSAQGSFAMTESMRTALSVASMVFCCLLAPTLIAWRVRLQSLLDTVNQRRLSLS